MLKFIGYILTLISILVFSYTSCKFLDIVWVFWIEVLGIIIYFIGESLEEN